MSLTWAGYKAQIRRSILNDLAAEGEEETQSWTDDQLLDAVAWAMDAFCAHTALPYTAVFDNATVKTPGDEPVLYDLTVDTAFTLPADVYEDVEVSSQVYVMRDGYPVYLDPVEYTAGIHPYRASQGYYIWPENILNVLTPLTQNDTLHIRYFAYYPHPSEDTDPILLPRWARMPVAYLTGAYALGPVGVQSASIDRFKDKFDSGNPEHNAIRRQQEWFMQIYEREIARYPRQDRLNAFREAH